MKQREKIKYVYFKFCEISAKNIFLESFLKQDEAFFNFFIEKIEKNYRCFLNKYVLQICLNDIDIVHNIDIIDNNLLTKTQKEIEISIENDYMFVFLFLKDNPIRICIN